MGIRAARLLACLALIDSVAADCLPTIPLVLDDMHDGDQKIIAQDGAWDKFVIHPYNNSESWEIHGTWDVDCKSTLDFHVPGKPDYPPVNLTATMWVMQSMANPRYTKLGFEFSDPSETLAPKQQPINFWIMHRSLTSVPDAWSKRLAAARGSQSNSCLYTPRKGLVYDDMHDGDMKTVTTSKQTSKGTSTLTITPYGNNETWVVKSTFPDDKCIATVDFDVPGKPNPPPFALNANMWDMAPIDETLKDKKAIVFTMLNSPDALNVWVTDNTPTSV